MTQKYIILGFIAIAFVAGSIMTSTIAYANDHQNGTPFLQVEIEAIEQLVLELQDRLDSIEVTWDRVTDKPDELVIVSTICTTDQIPKWDGTQWNCTDSASDSLAGDYALRKVDCNIIGELLDLSIQFDTRNGCNLVGVGFDDIELPGANLSLADLTDAVFDEADLSDVDFSGANLSGVDFYGTDLSGAIFTGAFANPPCYNGPICATLPTS